MLINAPRLGLAPAAHRAGPLERPVWSRPGGGSLRWLWGPRELLRARAAELGVSVPRLLVESALEGRETSTERRQQVAGLFEVRRLLATVANNVNQLARSANVSGEVAVGERLERTLVEVDELLLRIRALTGARR